MERKMIGVVPLVDYERESLWMLPGYMEGILEAGGLPVMLPLTDNEEIIHQLAHSFDGFLFTGGQDTAPELYGEEKMPQCLCSRERDEMEAALFRKVLDLDKPVLGICRGIQFINVMLGGTLYQDIPSQLGTDTEHHQKPPYDVPVHSVTIKGGTPLFKLLETNKLMVNSYHHQAVKKLAPKLKEMAVSEDGLVEGVYMEDKSFVWGLQWHPEFSWKTDLASRKIFKAFVMGRFC